MWTFEFSVEKRELQTHKERERDEKIERQRLTHKEITTERKREQKIERKRNKDKDRHRERKKKNIMCIKMIIYIKSNISNLNTYSQSSL